MQKVRIII